ncbi:MAG: hypothetical protein AB1593_07460 [Pseudomonadota bacterium]
MKRLLMACLLSAHSLMAWAISPYISADRVTAGELPAVAAEVEKKLTAAGFQVLGLYTPRFLPTHGVLVVTDPDMLNRIRAMGGDTIVAAPVRVGITTEGVVSYSNPDYWYRAFLRQQFPKAEPAARALQSRLARALGAGPGFGGDEKAASLPGYRYIAGMERFDTDKNQLAVHADFATALQVVQDNLARGVAGTSKVYELVISEKKIAVIGVAMNSPANGDAVLLGKLGVQERIAGFPYELFILDNEVHALFGRYRLALAFPDLSMGQFMRIVFAPDDIRTTLKTVAGGAN